MAAVEVKTSSSYHVAFVVYILVVLGWMGRLVYVFLPVNSDSAMFIYMGKMVAMGQRIGVDMVDNKFPTVGMLYYFPYRLFGEVWCLYAVLGFVMSIVAGWILARSVQKNIGQQAYLAVLVGGAVWLNFSPGVFGILQLETWQIFFASIGGAFAIGMIHRGRCWDALGLGICAGFCTLAKPTGIAVFISTGVVTWFVADFSLTKKLKLTATALFGLLLLMLVAVGYLFQTDTLSVVPVIAKQLAAYATNSTLEWQDIVKPLAVILFVLLPMLFYGFVFRRDLDTESSTTLSHRQSMGFFVVLWLVIELAGVIAQRRMYSYHFMTLAPSVSLLPALLKRRATYSNLMMTFAPILLISLLSASLLLLHSKVDVTRSTVLDYLKVHTNKHDVVWMDDYAQLMVESDLKPGSRVPLVFLFANTDDAPIRFGEMILKDFAEREPCYIVIPTNPDALIKQYQLGNAEVAYYPVRSQNFDNVWRKIDAYVHLHYTPAKQVNELTIWKKL